MVEVNNCKHRYSLVCLAALIALGAAASAYGQQASSELLNNPGFEGPYSPAPVQTGAGIITGVLADGWLDESSVSAVNVKYSEERDNAHGGQSAQMITIGGGGTVTVGQTVSGLLGGHAYRLSIWERGDGKASVVIGLRGSADGGEVFGQQELTSSSDWQNITVNVTPGKDGGGFFFAEIKPAGAVCIDDAGMTEVAAKK